MSSYNSNHNSIYFSPLEIEQKRKQMKREATLLDLFYRIGVFICMLFSIIGSLFVAWLLNCFGFFNGVFLAFVQPLVDFEITVGFYYGAFVVIGFVVWLITIIFGGKK